MIAHASSILDRLGNPADNVRGKLPADLINPLFAYSLNRKLRYLYDGPWFRFRQAGGGEHDFPGTAPNLTEDVFLVKMYDQKEKYGIPHVDALAVTGLEPKLSEVSGYYKATFEEGQYMTIAMESYIADEFHILLTGKEDYPRPALGMWGPSQSITIEPSTAAIGKFAVNRNRGGMKRDLGSNVYGCFYGYDPNQNSQRVMSVNAVGHNVQDETVSGITNIAIGRKDERYYTGEVLEVVLHLGDIKQKWGDLLTNSAQQFYQGYL